MNVQVAKPDFADTLDLLCPMHVQLDVAGMITHIGPTLSKLQRGTQFLGRSFFGAFDLLRPAGARAIERLINAHGERVHLRLRSDPDMMLQGVVLQDPFGAGALINLSFGIGVIDAVRRYDLTNADFAATDLTTELLFLVEAKSAAMNASRNLNERLEKARLDAQMQASTDALTGLKNRRAVERIVSRKLSDHAPFSFMQLDLDFFKAVNDTYGHAAGDWVLQRVAQILMDAVREDDHAARIGGDEFAIILHGKIGPSRISELSQDIITRLSEPMDYAGNLCRISASIGVSQVSETNSRNMDQIMHEADQALYQSKANGRSRFAIFDTKTGNRGVGD